MVKKLVVSSISIVLMVLAGIVLPVAGLPTGTVPAAAYQGAASTPVPLPPRPDPATATPSPSSSGGSNIFGRVEDRCLARPGLDAQVYIFAGALEGALPLEMLGDLAGLDSAEELAARLAEPETWDASRMPAGRQHVDPAAWTALYAGLVQGVTPTYVMTADGEGNYGISGLAAGPYTIWLNLPEGPLPLQPPLVVQVTGGDSVRVDLNYCSAIPLLPATGNLPATGTPLALLLIIGTMALLVLSSLALARRRAD